MITPDASTIVCLVSIFSAGMGFGANIAFNREQRRCDVISRLHVTSPGINNPMVQFPDPVQRRMPWPLNEDEYCGCDDDWNHEAHAGLCQPVRPLSKPVQVTTQKELG